MMTIPASFQLYKSSLESIQQQQQFSIISLQAYEAVKNLGGEFVSRFTVFTCRKMILQSLPVNKVATLDWVNEVHKKVSVFAPMLKSIDQSCSECKCYKLLLDHLRSDLLTPQTKRDLAQTMFKDFVINTSAISPNRVELVSRFIDLDWVTSLEPYLVDALCEVIRQHVKSTCAGIFNLPLLEKMLQWKQEIAIPWLGDLLLLESHKVTSRRLEFFVHETLGSLRISELFDMITIYPESTSALMDLNFCLARTHQHKELTSSFKEALERRLLHPGANTNSILIVYVRTIKALRLLDPVGVLLNAVQDSVRAYLRSRPETVRCVVTALTNDGTNTELFSELGLDSTEVKPLDFENGDNQDEDENNYEAEWEPEPIEADPGSNSLRGTNDILSMLVRIYGSVQVFVNEYRTLLADRLLKSTDFDVDSELRSLELLKLRFGEAAMHVCGLMIKDIADSRRINSNIKVDFPFEAVVVSRISWPGLSGDSFELHPTVKHAVKDYSKKFSELKKLRKIKWRHHVGVVELIVSVPGSESRTYSVAPVYANLLAHLVDRSEWSLMQLAQVLGLEEELTRKKMAFWVSEGVALETKRGGYSAATVLEKQVKDGGGMSMGGVGVTDLEHDADENNMTLEIGEVAKDKTHAQFVVHMLTNLGSMTVETIHKNLQLFSAAMGEHGYDRSEDELHSFLQVMLSQGTIELNSEGMFQIIAGN